MGVRLDKLHFDDQPQVQQEQSELVVGGFLKRGEQNSDCGTACSRACSVNTFSSTHAIHLLNSCTSSDRYFMRSSTELDTGAHLGTFKVPLTSRSMASMIILSSFPTGN